MTSKWDEEERRTDEEQVGYFPDLKRPVSAPAHAPPGPTKDIAYPPVWQRWGFPAGLTLGLLIGLLAGYLLTFLLLRG